MTEMNKLTGESAQSTPSRRTLIKLGAGAAAAMIGSKVIAQESAPRGSRPPVPVGAPPPPGEWRPHTGPGFQNTFDRLDHNGQMDEVTQKIVDFVHDFKDSDITPSAMKALNRMMVDSTSALIAGFEEEATRIAAKTARFYPAGEYKSTILGYGLTAPPEMAAFVNSAMVRMDDLNETPHNSNLFPAALAMGEALHSSGSQVLTAMLIGYEIMAVPGAGESVAPAMSVGRLMGLDKDRLANAVTIALTPHVALNKGVGAMSMWKGTRSAESVKCGVWAAMLAQQGMTGPPQPFEGRGGEWYETGRIGRPFKLPVEATFNIEHSVNKRFPSDQMTQQVIALMPQIRAWTKYDEIEWIEYYMPFGNWEEVADNPKWDPRNRDSADHSIPYVIARNLISGESYLDAFSEDKLPFRDPVVRDLINRITCTPVQEWRANGAARIVIHKKTGEEKYWDTFEGRRDIDDMADFPQMSDDDITNKFKRVCAYRHVSDAQRDKALEYLWNLGAVKDIAEPMRFLAKFGQPKAL